MFYKIAGFITLGAAARTVVECNGCHCLMLKEKAAVHAMWHEANGITNAPWPANGAEGMNAELRIRIEE
jgi:hypothetical protein